MSTAVFPTLSGQGWSVHRTPVWSTIPQVATSGKETMIALWSSPRYEYELTFNVLRQGTINQTAYTEFSELFGFFNNRQGMFDSFLYNDPNDNSVTDQGIGTGDGVATQYQLVRAFGNNVQAVLAPNVVTNIKVNGSTVSPSDYTVSAWDTSTPGIVTFTTPPAAAGVITATFTYYWPVRFLDDSMDFEQFMDKLFKIGKVSFITKK